MRPTRRVVLSGLVVGLAVLSLALLARVVGTIVFAVTVVYVLYPVRHWLVERGLPRVAATVLVTVAAFAGAMAILLPVGYVLYRRRTALLDLLRSLPGSVDVSVGGFVFVVETAPVLDAARAALTDLALAAATAAPVLSLKLLLFSLLVYAMLYRPQALATLIVELVPGEYRDVLEALHRRTRETLYAIYGLQAATALGTVVVAYPIFFFFGYDLAFSLAVVAGILQFVPVVGPSLLILALGAVDLLGGNTTRATFVLVVGLVVIGFLPDAVIRPQLAEYSSGMPTSLYFVGFVGGVLSLGAVGIVVGPLVVGLLAESVELLSAELDAPAPE